WGRSAHRGTIACALDQPSLPGGEIAFVVLARHDPRFIGRDGGVTQVVDEQCAFLRPAELIGILPTTQHELIWRQPPAPVVAAGRTAEGYRGHRSGVVSKE